MPTDLEINAWDEMLRQYRREFPKLSIITYDESWFFRNLNRLGWKMGGTTIWNTIYMDEHLIGTQRGIDMMQHEIVHVRDQHRWHILFFLSYYFLPIGPSFKALWEWRGYREDLARVWHLYKNDKVRGPQMIAGYKDWVATQFIYQNYAWMLPWPWLVRRIIDRFVAKLP